MKSLSKIILFALLVTSHVSSGLSVHEDDKEKTTSSSWFLNHWRHKADGAGGHKSKEGEIVTSRYRPVAGRMTCDRYPRVCHVKGSVGPDCCKKKCVDVRSDRLNCGMCGNKCKYPEVCCKGTCVNPLHDRKHCGRCGNKCRRGSFCNYGMCSYA